MYRTMPEQALAVVGRLVGQTVDAEGVVFFLTRMGGLLSNGDNLLTNVVVVSMVCVVNVVEVTAAGVVVAVVETVTVAGKTVHCANDAHASSLWL